MIKYDIFEPTEFSEKKYARIIEQPPVTTDEIARNIASGSTFSAHEVVPVLDYLYQEMEKALLSGRGVHLKGLGYFSLHLSGEVVTNEKGTEMLRHAQVDDIRFRPEQQFLNRFSKIELRREKRGGQSVSRLSDDDVLREAVRLTEEYGMFTPIQLESALHLHRKQVYRLLNRLEQEDKLEKVPIKSHQHFYRAKQ